MIIKLQIFRRWLFTFLQMQLFLSLVSLPVLVAWGLPLSYMTVIGNCIFSPFITLFLLCSSLIFFAELLHMPNGWLIVLLEYVTKVWIKALSCSSKGWLIGFPVKMVPYLLVIAIMAFFILQHKKWGKKEVSTGIFTVLFILIFGLIFCMKVPSSHHIFCKKKSIEIKRMGGKHILIDHGALKEKAAAESWISYTVMPALLKMFGTVKIDELHVSDESVRTKKAIACLQQEAIVGKVVMLKNIYKH